MNEITPPVLPIDVDVHELQNLQSKWWCFVALGITLIVCGAGAISFPIFSSVGVAIALGIALVTGGVAIMVTSFWASESSAFLVQLLLGILYVVLGLGMTESPIATTAAMTLLVASFSVASGAFRIIAALSMRFPQWGWVLVSGLFALIFGIIIFRHFPEASLWLIGTMLGIDLLFSGVAWTALGLEVRSLPNSSSVTVHSSL